MSDMFTTREIATGLWIAALIIFIFINKKTRKSAFGVIKAATSIKLIMPFLIMLLYTGLLVLIISFLPFWNYKYVKDIAVWVLFAGIAACYGGVNKQVDAHYFRDIILDNIKFAALVEFFISSFTFNIIIELALIPIMTFIVLIETFTETKKEYAPVKKLFSGLIIIFGLVIIAFTIRNAIQSFQEIGRIDLIVSFCIPLFFSIAYLPIAFGMTMYAKYESLFIRMSFKEPKDTKVRRLHKIKVVSACGLSYKKLSDFNQNYMPQMYITMDKCKFDSLIREFRGENSDE
jgi:hypothetical protein